MGCSEKIYCNSYNFKLKEIKFIKKLNIHYLVSVAIELMIRPAKTQGSLEIPGCWASPQVKHIALNNLQLKAKWSASILHKEFLMFFFLKYVY